MEKIKEYILTEEEQKACIDLVKSMREKEKVFTFNFKGSIKIKAKNLEEADDCFCDWIGDVGDMSYCEGSSKIIMDYPIFEKDGIEQR